MKSTSIWWSELYRGAVLLVTHLSIVGTVMVDTPAVFNYKNLEPYGITGEGRTELLFTIQACQDARVALYPYDPSIDSDTMYEVVFGGSHNKKHSIRTRKNDNNYQKNLTTMVGLLSCNDYREFWISWKNFYIIGGTGQTIGKDKVIEYNDTRSNPYIVKYIGISTWRGVTGKWIFKNEIPRFTSVTPSTVYVTRGDTSFLRCISVGIPSPVITWYKDGVNVTGLPKKYNTTVSGYLTILNYEDDDSGVYRCTATNTEGEVSHGVNVHCCDCCFWCEENSTILTEKEINIKLQTIKDLLYVDRKETALSKRSKISADDPRQSSMIVGMTCGVSVICTMVALLICPDLLSLLRRMR